MGLSSNLPTFGGNEIKLVCYSNPNGGNMMQVDSSNSDPQQQQQTLYFVTSQPDEVIKPIYVLTELPVETLVNQPNYNIIQVENNYNSYGVNDSMNAEISVIQIPYNNVNVIEIANGMSTSNVNLVDDQSQRMDIIELPSDSLFVTQDNVLVCLPNETVTVELEPDTSQADMALAKHWLNDANLVNKAMTALSEHKNGNECSQSVNSSSHDHVKMITC